MEKTCNTSIVKNYIRDYIAKNKLQPGAVLPSEGQIAEEPDIGRTSVREATRALESIGLIEIRKGKGLILRSFNLDAVLDIFSYGFILDNSMLFDLYEIRRMIECSLMPHVIENINDVVISQCEMILAEWAFLVQKGEAVHEMDRKFHDALYAPAGNKLLIGLCDIFWTSFKQAEDNGLIIRYFPDNKDDALSVLEQHRQILNAIKERDVKKSSSLMYQHFRSLEIPEKSKRS